MKLKIGNITLEVTPAKKDGKPNPPPKGWRGWIAINYNHLVYVEYDGHFYWNVDFHCSEGTHRSVDYYFDEFKIIE